MPRSHYDELHDQYNSIRTNKSGTRYERLAAVVFSALEERSVVIHDLALVGNESGVEHQIDVIIERDGIQRRVLLECKDFDISGDPVGLGIVRNFWGVVDDIHPDEAWIVTCNRFTSNAQRYAKAKGIKLATLRAFADSDWQSRVKTIIVNLTIAAPQVEKLEAKFKMDDADGANLARDYAAQYPGGSVTPECDQTAVFDGDATRSISQIVAELIASRDVTESSSKYVEGKVTPGGWVTANGTSQYTIQGYEIAVPVAYSKLQTQISAIDGAAALLLTGDDGIDFVVWDTTLEAFTIDDDGTVRLAADAIQKRLQTSVLHLPTEAPFPVPPGKA